MDISLGLLSKNNRGICTASCPHACDVCIHSLPPASLSPYLTPWQSGAWTWPARDLKMMQRGSPLPYLEEPKAFWIPQSFKRNWSPTRLPIHTKCWRDTCVFCLTGGILEQSPSCPENKPKPLGADSTKLTMQPTSESAPAALHLGPKGTLVPSCGHLL